MNIIRQEYTDFKIHSERLLLRPVLLADVNKEYVRWMNDQEINAYMETRFRPQGKQDIERYVEKMNRNENVFFLAIVIKDTHRHIGNIKLTVEPFHRRGEISLWIGDKKYWGKGIATEAIICLRDFAVDKLKLYKITAGCYSCNVGSAKAFFNAGFQQEAVLKNQYICAGKHVDRFCFSFVHSDGK